MTQASLPQPNPFGPVVHGRFSSIAWCGSFFHPQPTTPTTTMYATFLNQALPTDTSHISVPKIWADMAWGAAQITGDLSVQPLTEEVRDTVIVNAVSLIAMTGIVTRHYALDVDLATCQLAYDAGLSPGLPPHTALDHLVEAALTGNPYLRGLGHGLGLPPNPGPQHLAVAMQGLIASQPTEAAAFAQIWLGYAVMLNQIGSSMTDAIARFWPYFQRAFSMLNELKVAEDATTRSHA